MQQPIEDCGLRPIHWCLCEPSEPTWSLIHRRAAQTKRTVRGQRALVRRFPKTTDIGYLCQWTKRYRAGDRLVYQLRRLNCPTNFPGDAFNASIVLRQSAREKSPVRTSIEEKLIIGAVRRVYQLSTNCRPIRYPRRRLAPLEQRSKHGSHEHSR
uniref:Uncharacterized protein n=1 Tax=Trichuris muris TaxID=70415 RepID=A0A5S6QCY5_TRIMR